LVVRYNERTILDDATLGLDEGDRIGLVGRNGCGKTTFLRILAGLQTADGGEVTARRDLVVSYLSQDFTLEASLARATLRTIRSISFEAVGANLDALFKPNCRRGIKPDYYREYECSLRPQLSNVKSPVPRNAAERHIQFNRPRQQAVGQLIHDNFSPR
jgi:energy-coupling factor transporter ATP-binding protein EcfA2